MTTATTVQAIGECMVELVRGASRDVRLGYSGDTYNTSVYLHRAAVQLDTPLQVRFLTGVGADAESRRMRARWRIEHVGDDAIVVPGALPGLYLISTDDGGERSFSYWRGNSAAARLFAGLDWIAGVDADLVYLSGISLQLMSEESRAALVARLRDLRDRGSRIAFDTNYRPSGWPDVDEARRAMEAVLEVTDIALVTLDDEIALGTCSDLAGCVRRLCDLGVPEFAVKVGAGGVWVLADDVLTHVPTSPVEPLDTTAAGDSFNGGYLAARLADRDPVDAARVGNAIAGRVVLHSGAIVQAHHMPVIGT
jgi:2-dehydro-3-deoxygluconokinase